MAYRFFKKSNFKLFPEERNRCCITCIVKQVLPNLKGSKDEFSDTDKTLGVS